MTAPVPRTPQVHDADAIARLRPLLVERVRGNSFDPATGYLDLMEGRRESLSPITVAMRMPLVSTIYERYWRPGFGRLLKGVNGPSMGDEYNLAAELMQLRPGSVALDLGCGPANFARRFARTVGPAGLVVGYDGSETMLKRAVNELRRDPTRSLALCLGEATVLPFEDNAFDSVCCFAALHMFPDPFASLDEIVRVLGPGGRLALLTTRAPSGTGLRTTVVRAIGESSGQKMFNRAQIREALESRGLHVESQEPAGAAQIVSAVIR
ncbi:MAG: methyltransferase domain-containing protein [Solirubrobacterales bacterium]